mgnify:CR=1 FL=1
MFAPTKNAPDCVELFHTIRCIFIGMQNLQNSQPRQQRLDTDQDQHNAADALGGGAVLVAEHGTDLDADGGQQAGDNTLQKVLDTINGMGGAFVNPFPSFMPGDLLVGVGCGIGFRMVVYYKAKNAKKFRQGVEYGSARWGTAKDIEPYVDPVFENNVLLTATERLMMSGRPKQPKYARNKNILVIGGSGSGKTRFFVKPNLMQMHSSYVVTDPNGYTIRR